MENTLPDFSGRTVAIRALVGSHNYNLNTPSSDRDFKFFVIPTFDDLYSGKHFASANTSENFDYSCHDIRRLGELVWKANINFIEVLFSTDILHAHDLEWLDDDAICNQFATMNIPSFTNACFGMHKQKMGNLYKGTDTTKDLVEKFGYDTKEATHALRMLYVMDRFTETRNMKEAIWFEDDNPMRSTLLKLKAGEYSESEFRNLVQVWFQIRADHVRKILDSYKPMVFLKGILDKEIKEFIRKRIIQK